MNAENAISDIESAFAAVPRPPKAAIAECSCGGCQEIRDDFADLDPAELDPKRMRYHSWDMTFLTPAARHYFLPRWMVLGIRQPDMAYADASVETLGYEHGWDIPGGYTTEQQQAILTFLRFIQYRNGDRFDADLEKAWDNWIDPETPSEQESESGPGE